MSSGIPTWSACWAGPDKRHEPSRSRAAFETKQANKVLQDLVLLGARLQAEPILVDSGQWEAVPERPRPYADVREQVANELVKQPQFHAVCRIPRGGGPAEYRIKTPSFILLDESHASRDSESIRRRSRDLYCVPREEVEKALSERLLGGRDGRSRQVDLGDPPDDTDEEA